MEAWARLWGSWWRRRSAVRFLREAQGGDYTARMPAHPAAFDVSHADVLDWLRRSTAAQAAIGRLQGGPQAAELGDVKICEETVR